jgi:hypothetical protein
MATPDPSPPTGNSRGTRRAVQRALRTGHARDARIDALTRDLADRAVRNTWVLVFYGVLLALQLALLISRIITGDPPSDILLSAVAVVLWSAGLVWMLVNLARSRRYLSRT